MTASPWARCNGHWPCAPPTDVEDVVAVAGRCEGIRQHNHENHAAYAIWPFRQYALGKPDQGRHCHFDRKNDSDDSKITV